MPDHCGLLLQPADQAGEMVGHLADGLLGEHPGVCPGLGDGRGVIGPTRCNRRVAGLLKNRGPAVPAAREQPEAVDENDRSPAARVGTFDLVGRGGSYRRRHIVPPLPRQDPCLSAQYLSQRQDWQSGQRSTGGRSLRPMSSWPRSGPRAYRLSSSTNPPGLASCLAPDPRTAGSSSLTTTPGLRQRSLPEPARRKGSLSQRSQQDSSAQISGCYWRVSLRSSSWPASCGWW